MAPGSGTLHTFTVIRNPRGDYVLACVRLEEGPLVLAPVIDDDPGCLRIGMPLQACFGGTPEGQQVPMFRVRRGAGEPNVEHRPGQFRG